MSIGSEIIDKLAEQADWFKGVERIDAINKLIGNPNFPVRDLPRAYVPLSGASAGQANNSSGMYRQQRRPNHSIIMAVSLVNDSTGAKAVSDIEELVADTTDLLMGWTPPSADAPLVLARNAERMLSWRNNMIFYALNVECSVYLRKCK